MIGDRYVGIRHLRTGGNDKAKQDVEHGRINDPPLKFVLQKDLI